MNIATKNMNKMNNNICHNNCTSTYKSNGDTKERGDIKIIPNHALDTVGNPSNACLPPSRPILTSYALEYGGALRMIRVSVFSNDLCLREGQGLVYIREME
jgi:hypothetical protein